MALWLVRPGKLGEYEERFFTEGRIYLTWPQIQNDALSGTKDADVIFDLLQKHDPNESPRRLGNWAGQIFGFVSGMAKGDWIAVPRKTKAAIAIGQLEGEHKYDGKAKEMFRHFRQVKWMNVDVPRSAFDADILQSLAALTTICRIQRNNAEARVIAMAKSGWKMSGLPTAARAGTSELATGDEGIPGSDGEFFDLERSGRDQIAILVERRFTGHDMARLVEAILRAQGYATYASPPGPDGGVDIVAGQGPLGMGQPRLCVQVKATNKPIESKVLNELVGTMNNVNADSGLLVSWGGFKDTITRQTAQQFFQVRLWDADTLINELLASYDRLDDEIKAELPIKRMWTVAVGEGEGE